MKLGCHMSTGGGVWRALERALEVRCESVQLFVKNNMQWLGRPFDPEAIRKFSGIRAEKTLSSIFGHTGYLINVAAPPSANRAKSIESLVQEIQLADSLQLPFLVLHPGAHLGAGEDAGIQQACAALTEVFEQTKGSRVRIAIENTAGQGSCLGHRMAHLAALYDGIGQADRLGICLDTAHFFAAGYDIRGEQGWNAVLAELDKLIGLDQIVGFHLNDSRTELGSRVDRHAHIGEGKIGKEAFRHILNDRRFSNIPGCLETPKGADLAEDIRNLATLRSLIASPETTTRTRTKTGAGRTKKAGKRH